MAANLAVNQASERTTPWLERRKSPLTKVFVVRPPGQVTESRQVLSPTAFSDWQLPLPWGWVTRSDGEEVRDCSDVPVGGFGVWQRA